MHIIGRLTAPIMWFFISEGFHYTHDAKKYITRLGVFALVRFFVILVFPLLKQYNGEKGEATRMKQALQLQREQNKLERKTVSREQKLAEAKRQFALRQQKKKEKHKGR